jgi:hypothetical protein
VIETELLPAIEQDLSGLNENVPMFRQIEKRRIERQTVADRMLREYHSKKRAQEK